MLKQQVSSVRGVDTTSPSLAEHLVEMSGVLVDLLKWHAKAGLAAFLCPV